MAILQIKLDSTFNIIHLPEGSTTTNLPGLIVEVPDESAYLDCMLEQLYWDGEQVVCDTNWVHNIMPIPLIKSKEIAYNNNELNALLATESPTAFAITAGYS